VITDDLLLQKDRLTPLLQSSQTYVLAAVADLPGRDHTGEALLVAFLDHDLTKTENEMELTRDSQGRLMTLGC
jgi:hypothetical protein